MSCQLQYMSNSCVNYGCYRRRFFVRGSKGRCQSKKPSEQETKSSGENPALQPKKSPQQKKYLSAAGKNSSPGGPGMGGSEGGSHEGRQAETGLEDKAAAAAKAAIMQQQGRRRT